MILVVTAAGCGGSDQPTGDSTTSSTTTAQSTTTTSSVREVTAQVAGRALTGHCTGTQQDLPAVVLDSGMAGGQQELANLEEQLLSEPLYVPTIGRGWATAIRLPRLHGR